jgi:hypothetical protein
VRGARGLILAAVIFAAPAPALAAEGPSLAGPIGGTDIRQALLPPPGLYGGTFVLGAEAYAFLDGNGNTIPALKNINLHKEIAGPFLFYVPDMKVWGGSIGIGGMVPFGNQCGHLFPGEPVKCNFNLGDPYFEIDWARYFGTPRPSRHAGAPPIPQGLAILIGFGMVVPLGNFDASTPQNQALSIGTNLWDFAPTAAVTYTTAPIIGEGTEFSVKLYWNNYLENPRTHYFTGDLLDFQFAISEHFGRFQIGLAGFYAFQVQDDELFGVPVPPDGARVKVFELGPVIAYDIPERGTSFKVKALASIPGTVKNTVEAWGVVGGVIKKF